MPYYVARSSGSGTTGRIACGFSAHFLIDRGDRWTVSAFVRQRGQWYQSDQTLIDWLLGALDNDASPPWLPLWEDTHRVTVMT